MLKFEDFVEQSQRVSSLEELGSLFLKTLENEGYENFVLARISAFTLRHVPLSRFPEGYLAYYRDQKWDLIDPVIELSVRATRPFYWSDALPRTLSKKQKDFMNECRQIGVHSGVTIPFRGPENRVDLISMSRRTREPQDKKRLLYLYAISGQVWQRSLDFEAKRDPSFSSPIPRLSRRELECLAWSREGISYQEIGDKLNLSHRTVEDYMASAIRKLGAKDKVTAVVKAIHVGLI